MRLSQSRGPLPWVLLPQGQYHCPGLLCVYGQALSYPQICLAASSYLLGLRPLNGNTTRQYPRPQDKAKLQTLGYDIQSPQKPDLCYFP